MWFTSKHITSLRNWQLSIADWSHRNIDTRKNYFPSIVAYAFVEAHRNGELLWYNLYLSRPFCLLHHGNARLISGCSGIGTRFNNQNRLLQRSLRRTTILSILMAKIEPPKCLTNVSIKASCSRSRDPNFRLLKRLSWRSPSHSPSENLKEQNRQMANNQHLYEAENNLKMKK